MRRVSTCLQCSGPIIDCSSRAIPFSNNGGLPRHAADLRRRPQHFLSFQARPWSDACRSTPPILELGCESYRRAQYDYDACVYHRDDMSRRYAGALLVKGEVMPLASSYNYPALNIFWSIIEFILWVIWIWILIYVFIDIFRSRDLSGWAKALWFLFVLLIPLIGVLVYLIVRGSSMPERRCSRRNCRTANCAATSKRPRVRQPARRTSWPSSLTYATGVSSRPRNSHARRPRSWPERGPQSAD